MDKQIAGVGWILTDSANISEHNVLCPLLGGTDPGIQLQYNV